MSFENPACDELRSKIPEHWDVQPLDAVTDFQEGPGILAIDFRDTGIPLLRLRNIELPTVQLSGCNFLDIAKVASKWKHFELKVGDLLISTSASLGRVSVVGKDAAGSIAYTGIIRFRSSSKFLHHEYLRAFLSSSVFVEQAEKMATGSVIRHFGPSHLRQMAITLPSIKEQVQIAEIFDSLDDRISLLRETNTTLEAIAQALFKSWFVDFDPVRAKQHGNAPQGMDAATAALFPDSFEESELGEVPKGWKFGSLRDAVTIFDSKRIPLAGQDRAKRQGIYPYYGAAALMDHVDDFLFDGIYFLMGEDGSVADSDGFPITQYVWGKIWVNNHAHVLQGNNGISTEHLMLYVKQINVNPYITGAVQAKLSQSNMWRIPFLMPQKEIAVEFGKLIEPLFDKIRHNSDQIKTLTELRDTLLPRLISGQLRLPA